MRKWRNWNFIPWYTFYLIFFLFTKTTLKCGKHGNALVKLFLQHLYSTLLYILQQYIQQNFLQSFSGRTIQIYENFPVYITIEKFYFSRVFFSNMREWKWTRNHILEESVKVKKEYLKQWGPTNLNPQYTFPWKATLRKHSKDLLQTFSGFKLHLDQTWENGNEPEITYLKKLGRYGDWNSTAQYIFATTNDCE